MRKNEGVRRLSIAVGILAGIACCSFLLFTLNGSAPAIAWVVAVALSVAAGFAAWALVLLVAWVIEGFKNPSPH
jgi:hypothetical protein